MSKTHAKEPIALKIIVSDALASSIIGTGGCNVKELMHRSKTNVSVSQLHDHYPNTAFRTIIVSGSLSAVSFAQCLVCIRAARLTRNETPDADAYLSLETLHSVPEEVMQQWISIKISIPESAVGVVIGKGGSFIKAIGEQSGATVTISEMVVVNERLMHLEGSAAACIVAINLVLEKLILDPRLSRYLVYVPSYKSAFLGPMRQYQGPSGPPQHGFAQHQHQLAHAHHSQGAYGAPHDNSHYGQAQYGIQGHGHQYGARGGHYGIHSQHQTDGRYEQGAGQYQQHQHQNVHVHDPYGSGHASSPSPPSSASRHISPAGSGVREGTPVAHSHAYDQSTSSRPSVSPPPALPAGVRVVSETVTVELEIPASFFQPAAAATSGDADIGNVALECQGPSSAAEDEPTDSAAAPTTATGTTDGDATPAGAAAEPTGSIETAPLCSHEDLQRIGAASSVVIDLKAQAVPGDAAHDSSVVPPESCSSAAVRLVSIIGKRSSVDTAVAAIARLLSQK